MVADKLSTIYDKIRRGIVTISEEEVIPQDERPAPTSTMEEVKAVVDDILACNPGALRIMLMQRIQVHRDDRDGSSNRPRLTSWDLEYYNGITCLPESFGSLRFGGNLRLNYNCLESLPESFGNLWVGGDLILDHNHLESLPESFGSLYVGGDLSLTNNRLKTLPESFSSLRVGGNVCLNKNCLTALPESIGSLRLGGSLHLSHNPFPKRCEYEGLTIRWSNE